MVLKATVTDLFDKQLCVVTRHDGISVTEPISEGRTGSINLNMTDEAAKYITAGDRVVRISLDGKTLIKGIITSPGDDWNAGTLSVKMRDGTLKLMKRNLRYGHSTVDASLPDAGGIPVDGHGLRRVLADAQSNTGQWADAEHPHGVPHLGVISGPNDVPQLPANTDVLIKVGRGDSAWDVLRRFLDVSQTTTDGNADVGFECEFRPVVPGDADWAPGVNCKLYTSRFLGRDRTQTGSAYQESPNSIPRVSPLVLVWGRQLDGLTIDPDLNQMINYAVQVSTGGETDPTDTSHKAGAVNRKSMLRYGIFESWQAGGDGTPVKTLGLQAGAFVTAYAEPPQFVTATLKPNYIKSAVDGELLLGDWVTVVGRRGHRRVVMDARVTQRTFTQKDQNGNVQMAVELVPHRINNSDALFGYQDDN